MQPVSPRHTPVILMGAAILSDGRTAASQLISSVVVNAILEPGKKDLKDQPSPDWAPPSDGRAGVAASISISQRPIRRRDSKGAADRPSRELQPRQLQRRAGLDGELLRLTQVVGLRSSSLSEVAENLSAYKTLAGACWGLGH